MIYFINAYSFFIICFKFQKNFEDITSNSHYNLTYVAESNYSNIYLLNQKFYLM